jgi:carbohydrate-binding DOMON domain-containing protein
MCGTWERAGAAANGKVGAEGDATAVIAEISPRRREIRRPTPRPIPIAAPDIAPSASHPEADINGAVLGRHTHATTFTSHSSLASTAVFSLELPPTTTRTCITITTPCRSSASVPARRRGRTRAVSRRARDA